MSMTNTNPTPIPSTTTNPTRIKAPKSHKYRGVDPRRVVVVGHDTTKDLHDAELVELTEKHPRFVAEVQNGVWCLADDESNASPPADNLTASIKAKGEVEQAGKLIPVPITDATKNLAYVDDAGKVWDFYLAVVYGRKRTRAVRDLELGMTYKVEASNLKSAAADMTVENLVRRVFAPTVEAEKLAKLANEDGYSLQEIAAMMGEHAKTPTDRTVANKIKLTRLTATVAKMVDSGELKVTHAYWIADLTKGRQVEVARQVIDNKLTSVQTKALVKEISGEKPSEGKPVDTGNLPTVDAPPFDSATSEIDDSKAPEQTDPEPPTKPPAFDAIETTKTKRPKADEIEEMIEYLGGARSPLANRAAVKLTVAALNWVRGNMTEHEFLLKVAALHKIDIDALAPSEPEKTEEPEAQ